MSHALAIESQSALIELHAVLRDLDPVRFTPAPKIEQTLRQRIAAIAEQLSARVRSQGDALGDEGPDDLASRLARIATRLREQMPARDLEATELRRAWNRYRRSLQKDYENLRVTLSAAQVEVPTLRPTNWTRSGFHVAVSVAIVLLVEEVLNDTLRFVVPACFAATFWCLEVLRYRNATARRFLLWLFRHIAHPHERHRVNSATWFATALTIVGAFFDPVIAAVGVAVLGFGDPVAGLIGRRFGRTKLINNRSLQGTLAFVVAGVVAALAVMLIWHPTMQLAAMLGLALAAAVGGALAELFSKNVDDNLSIPVVAATAAWLAMALA